MKESFYKSYDDLPLFLDAKTVAQVLGVSSSSGYELMHQQDFPVLKAGKQIVVPKERFIQWVEQSTTGGRWVMLWQHTKQGAVKKFFPLPNEIFSLDLSPGELAVYSYLLFCEDRKTYQCWPSYRSIGKAVHMSANTVRKYMAALEENGLIVTEPTSITTKDGRRRNGSLLYTIWPIQEAVELHNQRLHRQLEETAERMRVAQKLAAIEEHPA